MTVQETETTKSYGRRRLQQTWQDARSQWPALTACGILAAAFAVGKIVRASAYLGWAALAFLGLFILFWIWLFVVSAPAELDAEMRRKAALPAASLEEEGDR